MRLTRLYFTITLLVATTCYAVAQKYNYVIPEHLQSVETSSKTPTGGGKALHQELDDAYGKTSLATSDNPDPMETKAKGKGQKTKVEGQKTKSSRAKEHSSKSQGRIFDYSYSTSENSDEMAEPDADGDVRTDGFGLENVYSVSGYEYPIYVWKYITTIAEDYSWQIRTCYTIIFFSILCLIALFVLFMIRVRIRSRFAKRYGKIQKRFEENFREVLINPESMTKEDIEEVCDCTAENFRKLDLDNIQRLIISLREELQEVIFIPNLEELCMVTGVRDRIEFNLVHHNDEFNSLQCVTILQLPISEGVLANYVNHRNLDIRNLARMCYILATQVEPYRYLLAFAKDTVKDNDWSPWYPMALHQLFGWIMSKDRLMPNFVTLIEQAESEAVKAFFIQEISYWGTVEEQAYLHNYFNDENHAVRLAAFQATAMLRDIDQEEELIKTYYTQPQNLRREILNAIYAIRSGKQTEFIKQVFLTSPSKETRELALTYLYDYTPESRLEFEALRNEHLDVNVNRNIFDQIESSKLLTELRNL